MKNAIQNEPVVTVAVLEAAIMAVLYMLVSLNVISLNEEQLDTISKAVIAIFPLLLIGTALIQRQFVTPVQIRRESNEYELSERL